MPSYKEIFEIEKQRTEAAQWNVIHLFKEGSTYKAYEWSAWICREFCTNEERLRHFNSHMLTPVHKTAKNTSGTIVFVGFPPSSIDKFIPKDVQTGFNPVSDNQIDISIELPATLGEMNTENLQKHFDAWKESWPLKQDTDKPEGNNRKNNQASDAEVRQDTQMLPFATNGRQLRMTDIITELVSLPLEDVSPNEALKLLRQLHRQAVSLF